MRDDEKIEEINKTPGWTIESIKESALTMHTVRKTKRPYIRSILDTAFDMVGRQKSPHMTDVFKQSRRLNKLGDVGELDFAADILNCDTLEDAKIIANAVIKDWQEYNKSC